MVFCLTTCKLTIYRTKKNYYPYFFELFRLGISVENPKLGNDTGSSILKASKLFDLDIRLHEVLGSDLFWATPELDPNVYQHPEGKPMFDIFGGKPRKSLTQPGIFAECEDPREVS